MPCDALRPVLPSIGTATFFVLMACRSPSLSFPCNSERTAARSPGSEIPETAVRGMRAYPRWVRLRVPVGGSLDILTTALAALSWRGGAIPKSAPEIFARQAET